MPTITPEPLRVALADAYRSDENQAVQNLITYAKLPVEELNNIHRTASDIVIGLRAQRLGKGGLDAFLSEYNLSSHEGIALMCIAESMLRIPDSATIDRLIKDKLTSADWESHVGKSDSLFVNAATWSLMLTGKIITDHDQQQYALKNVVKTLTKRSSEPFIRKAIGQAMRILGKQFVMGRTIKEGVRRARDNEKKGYRYSYDMLGEGARTVADAQRYFQAYSDAIDAIGAASKGKNCIESPGVSVKLSALHPRYEFAKQKAVVAELVPKVLELACLAKRYDIGFTIDAEEANRLDLSLDIIEKVFSAPELQDWQGFGLAIQAYQKRCFYLIDWLVGLSRRHQRRIMVRLVKGAYWDSEIKRSQVEGFNGYPVFTRKANTDVSYIACAKKLLQHPTEIYPQFATHNAYSVAVVMELAKGRSDYEFQCLHGMGQVLYDQIVGRKNFNIPCRIYAPIGSHKDLLPYLVRRLLENGANSSFVNRIVDSELPLDDLIADPVAQMETVLNKTHPKIPLPKDIYGNQRINSSSPDLSNFLVLNDLMGKLQQAGTIAWKAAPTLAENLTDTRPVINPADFSQVGMASQATEADLEFALQQAHQAQPEWQKTPIKERADCLRAVANLLEQKQSEFYSIAIREAGKTINDAIAEVREAIDFCRYYAQQAEKLPMDTQALGTVLCISPWNFPLAIFLGQVSAALVTGNAVLAKPADQTPLIAARAVELLHEAGVPKAVVQLIPGRGSVIGAKLVSNPGIRAVMFTGSTETAQIINQNLADRGGYNVPFIAETGGQNAMIVDSSALPEQVIDDVIISAFGSAGQRCSALRVLFVQDDIGDTVITMLRGAMAELQVGHPNQLATDVGPVIDQTALKTLTQHAEQMKLLGKLIYQVELDPELTGHFFPPTAIEIDNLAILKREVFGPILHVIRFKASELKKILYQIQATGYGLTMGIHSRIEQTVRYIHDNSAVGNTYVNRNMIGAVVGVQPFGGEGLSGTGPKAGGPHYLRRLCLLPCASSSVIDPGKRCIVDEQVPTSYVKDVARAVQQTQQSSQEWKVFTVVQRIKIMRHVAELFTEHKQQFIHLMMAKEYCPNIAQSMVEQEWQHAVERLLYYVVTTETNFLAPQIMQGPTGELNQLEAHPRGLVACMTPWYSPLAVSMGQISSALLMGNRVIVKPAQQTSAIVMALAELFYQAGLPKGVLQIVPGVGIDIGEQLIKAPEVGVVMFAGDAATAKRIKQTLAKRMGSLIPLVLEQDAPCYLERLSVERTLTVNTTATGGNATLLSLTED